MNAYRSNALAAGTLLIIATVATAVLGTVILKPVVGDPVDLSKVAANHTQVFLGALLSLIGAAACPAIAFALYPVLRDRHATMALGSVAFRIVEATFYVVSVVGLLMLVTLADEAARPGADVAFYERLAALVLAARVWTGFIAAVLFFGLGALLYYTALFRAALVPRWLSGWGIAAAVSALGAAMLGLFGVAAPLSPLHIALNLPIAVQEIALAVWLIARGFALPAAAQAGAATTALAAVRPR